MYGRQILKKLNGLAIHKKRFNCSEIVFNLYVVSITFFLFPRLLKWQVFLALPTHITVLRIPIMFFQQQTTFFTPIAKFPDRPSNTKKVFAAHCKYILHVHPCQKSIVCRHFLCIQDLPTSHKTYVTIGHLRVAPSLCFKARLSAKLLIRK